MDGDIERGKTQQWDKMQLRWMMGEKTNGVRMGGVEMGGVEMGGVEMDDKRLMMGRRIVYINI